MDATVPRGSGAVKEKFCRAGIFMVDVALRGWQRLGINQMEAFDVLPRQL